MNFSEFKRLARKHPRQAIVLATVAQTRDAALSYCADDALMAVVWALSAAERWTRGEAELDEVQAAAAAAYAAVVAAYGAAATAAAYAAVVAADGAAATAAAYAAYAADGAAATAAAYAAYAACAAYAAAYAADADAYAAAAAAAAREQFARRLGSPGKWGQWVECAVEGLPRIAVAGDYIWDGESFRARQSLTGSELVALDWCLERGAAA